MIHELCFRAKHPHIVWLSSPWAQVQNPVRHLDCPAVARQARSKHLETSCVPPELAVVAELSHDFALFLQIYSLWALYQLDWKLYPTDKHELCYKDTPIYFLLFFVKIWDQINRLWWLHGLCSPLPLSVVLFLMAVSPPPKYIN